VDTTPTISVSVTGTAREGHILTASAHVTTDADGGITAYQWQGLIGTAWTNITDATNSTYTIAATDDNLQLRVVASFTDDTGQSVAVTSTPTAVVVDVAPKLTVSVTGNAIEGSILTATPHSTSTPTPSSRQLRPSRPAGRSDTYGL